jgi:type I restriction enzyme, S subunit
MTASEESTVAYANVHSQGTTIPYAVWDGSLAEMPLVIPPDHLLLRFEKAVSPMLARISQYFFTFNNLGRTRDLLMPKLMSGEIDVSRAAEPQAIAV